jgi:hypothetical protein
VLVTVAPVLDAVVVNPPIVADVPPPNVFAPFVNANVPPPCLLRITPLVAPPLNTPLIVSPCTKSEFVAPETVNTGPFPFATTPPNVPFNA